MDHAPSLVLAFGLPVETAAACGIEHGDVAGIEKEVDVTIAGYDSEVVPEVWSLQVPVQPPVRIEGEQRPRLVPVPQIAGRFQYVNCTTRLCQLSDIR